jgi:hypothetical protein
MFHKGTWKAHRKSYIFIRYISAPVTACPGGQLGPTCLLLGGYAGLKNGPGGEPWTWLPLGNL